MSSSFQQPSGFRDLFHALVLLCAVPLLFFGAYKLLKETHEIEPEPPPSPFVDPAKHIAPVINKIFPPKPPAPGEAWLEEITRLEQKLNDLRLTTEVSSESINAVRQRLTALRRHCETYIDHVPADLPGSVLGQAVLRIAQQSDTLPQTQPSTPVFVDLDQQFEASNLQRLQEQGRHIQQDYDDQSIPINERHHKQLTSIARENRGMEDRLQQLKDQTDQIRRDTESQLSKNARKQAFEQDRAEIQRLLAPFITPGYCQLGSATHIFKTTTEAQPLSYRDLERLRALQPGIDGLTVLARIGSYPYLYENKSRPMGAFPAYSEFLFNNPVQLETVKRAQYLIKTHGPYLVEAGLLLP